MPDFLLFHFTSAFSIGFMSAFINPFYFPFESPPSSSPSLIYLFLFGNPPSPLLHSENPSPGPNCDEVTKARSEVVYMTK